MKNKNSFRNLSCLVQKLFCCKTKESNMAQENRLHTVGQPLSQSSFQENHFSLFHFAKVRKLPRFTRSFRCEQFFFAIWTPLLISNKSRKDLLHVLLRIDRCNATQTQSEQAIVKETLFIRRFSPSFSTFHKPYQCKQT